MITQSISASVRFDAKSDQWHATLTLEEHRNGRQYGGKVVKELKSRAGAIYETFWRRIRREAIKEMETVWT